MANPIISSAYCGFYHLPLVWFSQPPSASQWKTGDDLEVFKVVYEKTLHSNIRVRVRRDGMIWFDCNSWPHGTYTKIPGDSSELGSTVPSKALEAEQLAEERAYNRIKLINAYQQCLHSAHMTVARRATTLSYPIYPKDVLPLSGFHNRISWTYNTVDGPYSLYVRYALQALRNRDPESLERRSLVVEPEVIDYSFELLDKLLADEKHDALKIVELLFWGNTQFGLNSYSDSLVIAWVAIESLLNQIWKDFLEFKNSPIAEDVRINSKRKEKLQGRDFSASVISEILELQGILPLELFKRIDEVRRKRNAWVHSLRPIGPDEAEKSLATLTQLFCAFSGLDLKPGNSRLIPGTGGFNPELYTFPQN